MEISSTVIDDAPSLMLDGLAVYVFLCRHADEDGKVTVSATKMADGLGISPGRVNSGRKKLEALGLVRVEHHPNPNGTHGPNTYTITDGRQRRGTLEPLK